MAIGTGEINGSWALHNNAHIAHGVLISIAVVLWFPLGVFLLRLLNVQSNVLFHAAWQSFGLVLLLVGFGLGAWLSNLQGGLYQEGHVILGIIITALFLLEPIVGMLHHRHFTATGGVNYMRQIHVWMGRILLVLSLINGGTGLKLADNTMAGGIVYGGIAVTMLLTYVGVWWWLKKQQKANKEQSQVRGVPLENIQA